MERILLLEDDKSLVTGLTLALGRAGYALDTARTLAEAGHLWQAGRYDLLMLDVTLPDGTGFDFCREVRRTSGVPILFLTASDEEMDIITGLDLGGADYINVLYSEFLNFDPDDAEWVNRDRFFLDPGHMSPMLYATLSLIGKYSMEDLKNFRQWGSITPGHPE